MLQSPAGWWDQLPCLVGLVAHVCSNMCVHPSCCLKAQSAPTVIRVHGCLSKLVAHAIQLGLAQPPLLLPIHRRVPLTSGYSSCRSLVTRSASW
eukprot:6763055-Pyramimonas_sp.AAC.1